MFDFTKRKEQEERTRGKMRLDWNVLIWKFDEYLLRWLSSVSSTWSTTSTTLGSTWLGRMQRNPIGMKSMRITLRLAKRFLLYTMILLRITLFGTTRMNFHPDYMIVEIRFHKELWKPHLATLLLNNFSSQSTISHLILREKRKVPREFIITRRTYFTSIRHPGQRNNNSMTSIISTIEASKSLFISVFNVMIIIPTPILV